MASGKSSRAKGVRGEHESADIFRAHGFEIVRLQNNVLDAGDYAAFRHVLAEDGGWENLSLLVDAKLRKRIDVLAASQQIEAVAREGQIPALVYRYTMPPGQRAQPWRVSLRLEDLLRIVAR